jgi:hypothetical protein
MKTSLLKKLKTLFFGNDRFLPYCGTNMMYKTGRLYVQLKWTTYRRWRGLWRLGFQRREGLMELSLHFNPGLPVPLFETFLELNIKGGGHSTLYVPMDGLTNMVDIFDVMESQDEQQWSCTTVVRSADDLMVIHNWFENLSKILDEKSAMFGGRFNSDERCMARDLLGRLTERLSTCQLNS